MCVVRLRELYDGCSVASCMLALADPAVVPRTSHVITLNAVEVDDDFLTKICYDGRGRIPVLLVFSPWQSRWCLLADVGFLQWMPVSVLDCGGRGGLPDFAPST